MIDELYIEEVEKKIKRVLSAIEVTMLIDMEEVFTKEEIMNAIDKSIYKSRPIDYARGILRNERLKAEGINKEDPVPKEVTDWSSAWNILNSEEAPQELKEKALIYINRRR